MSETQEKLNKQLFNVIADEKVSDEARLKKVKYLVRLGADVNASSKYGKTALMIAATWGHLDVVKCLAECGADLKAKDVNGDTAFDIARKWEKADCVKFLEEYKKKVSAQKNKGDKTGASPFVKKNEGR